MFDEKFVLLVEEAVKEKDINHVVETNALKRKNDETEERRKLESYDCKEEKAFNWIDQSVEWTELNKPIRLWWCLIVLQFLFLHLCYV